MLTTFTAWPLAFRFPSGWIGTDLKQSDNDYLACLMNGVDVSVWRSTDGGATFTLLSTPFAGSYSHGYLAINGNDVYCSAKHTNGSTLYVKRSADGGATWGAAAAIASGTGLGDPALACGDGKLWCCYYAVSAKRIDVRYSSDHGANWTSCTSPMALGAGTVEDTAIVVLPSGRVVISWEWEFAEKGASQIWTAYSDDLGSTWAKSQMPFFEGADNEGGHLAISGAVMTCVFGSNALRRGVAGYDGIDLWQTVSGDAGQTWSTPSRIGQWPLIEPCIEGVLAIGTSDYDPAGVMSERVAYAFEPADIPGIWLEGGCGMAVMRNGEKVLEFSGTNPTSQRGFLLLAGDGDCVEAELLSDSAYVDLRVVGRYRDQGNHYLGLLQKNGAVQSAMIYRCLNGSYSLLASASHSLSSGMWYKVKMRCTGASIQLFVNDVAVLTATDASHSYGRGGISATYIPAAGQTFCRSIQVG